MKTRIVNWHLLTIATCSSTDNFCFENFLQLVFRCGFINLACPIKALIVAFSRKCFLYWVFFCFFQWNKFWFRRRFIAKELGGWGINISIRKKVKNKATSSNHTRFKFACKSRKQKALKRKFLFVVRETLWTVKKKS